MGLLDSFKSLLRSKVNIRNRFELLKEAISGTMSSFYGPRSPIGRDRRAEGAGPRKDGISGIALPGLGKPCEGDIAMRFTHPRIVRTLEHGITTDDEQYLVMEFLEGPGLNSLIIGRSSRWTGGG